ncbi:MAG: 4Fe-4S binding protein [Corynebacteriales bacterium]|uniref:ferredoxin--NADP(+) reductase n=1 Tax=Williamsia herbipolensis TaxID=1603258 RepID=A0AAU4JYN0_9NOCA|nr:4Fe-4S binding protein [Williamsia herbipolensis]MCX6470131.1 4Fe-4S binding protein [Mycobacteriales bacterium]
MAFAITQSCCSDAGCVSVCPVNCIHPAPGEPGFGTADILHIDPDTCIDCGACSDACPVDAIFPVDRLGPRDLHFAEVNAAYYRDREVSQDQKPTEYVPLLRLPEGMKVALVGTGPSAGYALRTLLMRTAVEVTVIDKLPTPGGLVRSGVAPDHPATKNITRGFDLHLRDPRVTVLGGVEVGRDVSPQDLADHFDAVFYAIGASEPRRLGIPGEDLPGSTSASAAVAWYNGIPDAPNPLQPADIGRTVIVGTGNVALDIVRLFHTDLADLGRTDIADRALDFFEAHRTHEVVLLGRRGRDTGAHTPAEYTALVNTPGVEIITVDASDQDAITVTAEVDGAYKRIVFLYDSTPLEVLGDDRVRAVRVRTGDVVRDVPADNLISSIGYRTRPIPGLPFDDAAGRIPNEAGRISDASVEVAGSYVVGWAKRGPTGGIGANRADAEETVQAFIADAAAGRLATRPHAMGDFDTFLRRRGVAPVRARGIATIDRVERRRGTSAGRPRVKLTSETELRQTARPRRRRIFRSGD